jgi:hypothetical protein
MKCRNFVKQRSTWVVTAHTHCKMWIEQRWRAGKRTHGHWKSWKSALTLDGHWNEKPAASLLLGQNLGWAWMEQPSRQGRSRACFGPWGSAYILLSLVWRDIHSASKEAIRRWRRPWRWWIYCSLELSQKQEIDSIINIYVDWMIPTCSWCDSSLASVASDPCISPKSQHLDWTVGHSIV